MLLRGRKVNLSSSSIKFMILTYRIDDLVEVEKHSCVAVCTTNEPKSVTKSSYDTLKVEKGEREKREGRE